jgi:hypothetical protein
MTGTAPMSSAMAFELFTEHPRFKYRGCAPDVDDPTRAAGDLSLPRNAWITDDRDGAEPQRERKAREAAAIEVCLGCPVMVLCDAYASSVRPDGRLAEPRWVWGGRTALERHRRFIGQRHEATVGQYLGQAEESCGVPQGPAPGPVPVPGAASVPGPEPVEHLQTKQKQAVLQALAAHSDPGEVARVAGVDWRTASWQRSRLVTQFGLDKSRATRVELLRAAVRRGLLDAGVVVEDDGSVPAVPPSPPRVRGRAARNASPARVRPVPRERTACQLTFDDLEVDPAVVSLYPSAAVCLEAAA